MLERERVISTLAREETDRVPVDFWAVPEMQQKLFNHFNVSKLNDLLDCLSVDIREVQPRFTGKTKRNKDGTFYSNFGVLYKSVSNKYSTYYEHAAHPLAKASSPDDIQSYTNWADASEFDWENFADQIGDLHKRYYVKIQLGGLFETAWAMRGLEQFFIDIAEESEIPHIIMKNITDYFIDYFKRAMEVAGDKIDLVYTYDDIASQQGLLMSPAMWEEYIAPYHRQLNKVISGYGKKIMYHSCGAVFPLIGRIMELPVDILNPLQTRAAGMDIKRIKTDFGDKLCFHGAIDIQELLPFGTQNDVREAVRKTIACLGVNGGYILSSSHYIQADTSVENVTAMYDVNLR